MHQLTALLSCQARRHARPQNFVTQLPSAHGSVTHAAHAEMRAMPQIMRLLLSSLTMEAKLSLEALLDLVAVLARDLQEQYLPYFPKVMAR